MRLKGEIFRIVLEAISTILRREGGERGEDARKAPERARRWPFRPSSTLDKADEADYPRSTAATEGFLRWLLGRISGFFYFFSDLTTYLRFHLRKHPALDFVSMGLGIRARHRRNMKEWQPHLEQCRRFLRESLRTCSKGEAIAVLGAGRLYDFPLEEVSKQGWKIDLYDYDPALRTQWQRARRSHQELRDFYVEDLTGVMELWSRELAQLPSSSVVRDVAQLINELPRRYPPRAVVRKGYGCVVSLNILSQLGLYWRDRVDTLLVRLHIARAENGQFPTLIEAALNNTVVALERGHIESLRSSGADQVIIISDRAYLYYVDDTAHCDEYPALTAAPVLERYQAVKEDSWFWHIAPRGREQRTYGEIHEVVAQSFRADTAIRPVYPSAASDAAPVSAA